MKCGYGGHAMARPHAAMTLVESPPDALGRKRRVAVCTDGAASALSRGWKEVLPTWKDAETALKWLEAQTSGDLFLGAVGLRAIFVYASGEAENGRHDALAPFVPPESKK